MIKIWVSPTNFRSWASMYVDGAWTIEVLVPDNFNQLPPYWEYDPVTNSMVPYDPVIPQPDYAAIAKAQQELLIAGANDYINSRQWPARSLKGRLSTEEDALFDEWLTYLEALYAVDITAGQNAVFPEPPEKPDSYTM